VHFTIQHFRGISILFTKDERKEFLIKLGKRWIFPDFSNRVTWYAITLGATVILFPTPGKLIFYNWLVDSFNINSGKYFIFADFKTGNADYWLGFSLIIFSLYSC
jgi:hypothetical protein